MHSRLLLGKSARVSGFGWVWIPAGVPCRREVPGVRISVATRLCGAGDGDQILTTGAFAAALECVPTGIELVEVGEYLLRSGRPESERIFRVEGAGLRPNTLSLRSFRSLGGAGGRPGSGRSAHNLVRCEKEKIELFVNPRLIEAVQHERYTGQEQGRTY